MNVTAIYHFSPIITVILQTSPKINTSVQHRKEILLFFVLNSVPKNIKNRLFVFFLE